MRKDYRGWMSVKERLHNSERDSPFFKQREIWFCHLGENIGLEEDGKGNDYLRPVIIFRAFGTRLFWGVPLTSTLKRSPYTFIFTPERTAVRRQRKAKEESAALLSQIRLIDAKRLHYLMGYIKETDFVSLKRKFKTLLP